MEENHNYNMTFAEAQEYTTKCGFSIPWNDGDVFVDERDITRTVGNVLKWQEDRIKQQMREVVMEKKRMTKAEAVELLKNKKVYVNGKSAEIQEKLFELGFKWYSGTDGQSVHNKNHPFLIICQDMLIGCTYNMIDFSNHKAPEISAEEILAIEVVEELKENDMIVAGWEKDGKKAIWVSVVQEGDSELYYEKVGLMIEGKQDGEKDLEFGGYCDAQQWIRPATEEEKKKLIDALKLSSDSKARDILKEVFGIEKAPECPFKPFDRVLVRDSKDNVWKADIFSNYDKNKSYPFQCVSNFWRQCISYEGNEHLVGTTNNPEE